MKKIRFGILHKKPFILLVVVCLLIAVLGTVLAINAAENGVEYIYFDLSAGSITVNGSSYSGYAYQKDGNTFTKATISGTWQSNQVYYVYQSQGGDLNPDGYFVDNEGVKSFTLPTRASVTVNGDSWGNYITNNSDVEGVITAWNTVATTRTSTPNRITVTGQVNATLVIDNLWSSYEIYGTSRTTGGISFYPQKANSHLTIQTKGDNRFGNIFYHNNETTTTLTFDEKEVGSSLTVCNLNNNANNNYWCAAIGGNDGGQDNARGIVISGGTIFAGTNARDDCTAIGGGGNGYGGITINGGRVTATVISSGAAIGGGIGKTSNGGQADVTIGGDAEVYAYNASCTSRKNPGTTTDTWYSNHGVKYIPAAAIGGGSSAQAQCSACTVTIQENARVYAQTVGGAAIGGGSSADNHGGNATVKILGNAQVTAKSLAGEIEGVAVSAGNAIGGGTGGKRGNGGYVKLEVADSATLNAGSVGGGGTITDQPQTYKIGYANITISGGMISAQFIMAGGASQKCTLDMTGGTIDNASRQRDFVFLKENGGAIYMDDSQGKATISGGTIQNCSAVLGGALYMTAGETILSGTGKIISCTAEENGGAIYMGGGTLTMSGGTLSNNTADNGAGAFLADGTMLVSGGVLTQNNATVNGGAAYLGGGEFTISGGTIEIATADYGGAIYVSGGNVTVSDTGTIQNCDAVSGGAIYVATGDVTMTGGTLTQNEATENGGTICISGGGFSMSGGSINNSKAVKDGGAVYVSNGNAVMGGGQITSCQATANGGAVCVQGGMFTINDGTVENGKAVMGGAVYVSGGNVNVNGGTLTACNADMGGAVYVEGGTVTMLGGAITENHAINGNGGAIYVTGTVGLEVSVHSGQITGNTASVNGGAICVIGETSEVIQVQIGVNELHYNEDGSPADEPCDHNGDSIVGAGNCPLVQNNTCAQEGGAIYISGSKTTKLDIFCIKEEGNRSKGNAAGGTETALSDFLKVDGGSVLISATNEEGTDVYYGNSVINSSVHVTGGDLKIQGTMTNPSIMAPITVDVVKAGGSYGDVRENDPNSPIQYYVVNYFENYKEGGSENATGQYTANQIPSTEPHTVWGVIYSHPGYTIVGWNTDENDTEAQFGVSTVITYDDFKNYLIDGITLKLYAIWKRDFYWIKFEPNAPGGYTGSMGDADKKLSFLCGDETNTLPKNLYVNEGNKFLGWATDSKAETPVYTDAQVIEPLSRVTGTVITLYAVWDVCDHTEQVKFVFKQNGSDSVICTCQCAYTVTMLLKAPSGAVYDGQPHAATPQFTHSHDGFTQEAISAFQALSIVHTKSGVTEEPINAGEYTATITVNGLPLYVVYNIAKATQAAPEKPTFEASGGNLTVNLPVRVMGDAGTQIHYQLVHKEADGDPVPTAWQTDLTFSDFDESWTLYYVVAYYPGNDNYLDSSEVVSDQKYIYEGKIEIIIVNGDGFASTLPVGGGEGEAVRLVSTPLDAFYLTSAYKATITGELKKGDQVLTSDEVATHFVIHAGPGEFYYTIIAFEGTVEGKITITFDGAKQKATVTPSVAPNERFDDITGVQTEIANNSAFTAYFDVKYFDSAVYTDLSLCFNRSLPVGTTLIMLNKADHRLWYVTVTTPTAVIAISEFQPMGGGSGTLAMNDLLQYQFVVDFSDTENMDNGELTMWFTATNNDSQYAPDLPNLAATVLLKEITPTFSEPAVNQNSASIEMQYVEKTDNASKWNDREVALVLIPDNATRIKLPIDAAIEVIETVDGQTKSQTYTRLDDGSFIVVLNRNASDFKIVLRSQMFKTAEYTFALYYYAAYDASAPMNGIELARATMTLHSVEKAQNSALIAVDGDSRVYDMNSGVIKASIQTEVKEGYTATVTLMRKNSDGEYVSTAWSEDLESGTKEIEIQNLSSFSEGIFALTVVVREESSNTAVLEVSHYFIIQK